MDNFSTYNVLCPAEPMTLFLAEPLLNVCKHSSRTVTSYLYFYCDNQVDSKYSNYYNLLVISQAYMHILAMQACHKQDLLLSWVTI